MTTNPLLGSWGRDAREMQLVLAATGDRGVGEPPTGRRVGSTTLLRRIQDDIRADRSPPGVPLPGHHDARAFLDPDDRSIQVHACHGRARQVEVLRDAVLHLLEEDPDLEPRDILVMCPDIETYAPFIDATFGATEPVDDRRRRAGNFPTCGCVSPTGRCVRPTPSSASWPGCSSWRRQRVTASQVLDLAGRDPVR